jgi:hypothetical protein
MGTLAVVAKGRVVRPAHSGSALAPFRHRETPSSRFFFFFFDRRERMAARYWHPLDQKNHFAFSDPPTKLILFDEPPCMVQSVGMPSSGEERARRKRGSKRLGGTRRLP